MDRRIEPSKTTNEQARWALVMMRMARKQKKEERRAVGATRTATTNKQARHVGTWRDRYTDTMLCAYQRPFVHVEQVVAAERGEQLDELELTEVNTHEDKRMKVRKSD